MSSKRLIQNYATTFQKTAYQKSYPPVINNLTFITILHYSIFVDISCRTILFLLVLLFTRTLDFYLFLLFTAVP